MVNEEPLVTVLVCTCDRGELVLGTVQAVLAGGFDSLELLVLDQSTDERCARALQPLCEQDGRVRLIRLGVKGKPLALNHGLSLARGRYVVLTDDDCEPVSGWLAAHVAAFEAEPQLGCVFGDVDAPAYDPARGFIPVCHITRSETIRGLTELLIMPGLQHFGIGANMALRRDVLMQLGGWDPWIGPGTKFGSGDDVDLSVRILRAGHAIHFCASAKVLHYGFRESAELGENFARNGFGMGAIFAKHLKCGALFRGALRLLASRLRTAALNAATGNRPLGAAYPLGWLKGVQAGLRHPIVAERALFAGEPPSCAAHAARVARVDASQVRRGP